MTVLTSADKARLTRFILSRKIFIVAINLGTYVVRKLLIYIYEDVLLLVLRFLR
jgi:hypothetical protein